MNEQAVIGALQTRLLTLGWGLSQTALGGKAFTPTAGQPYQEVEVVFHTARGRTHAGSSWGQGTFQVRVMWPLADVRANGKGLARARGKAIKDGFPMNLRLTGAGGQVVKVAEEPVVLDGVAQGDRDVTLVRFRFWDR